MKSNQTPIRNQFFTSLETMGNNKLRLADVSKLAAKNNEQYLINILNHIFTTPETQLKANQLIDFLKGISQKPDALTKLYNDVWLDLDTFNVKFINFPVIHTLINHKDFFLFIKPLLVIFIAAHDFYKKSISLKENQTLPIIKNAEIKETTLSNIENFFKLFKIVSDYTKNITNLSEARCLIFFNLLLKKINQNNENSKPSFIFDDFIPSFLAILFNTASYFDVCEVSFFSVILSEFFKVNQNLIQNIPQDFLTANLWQKKNQIEEVIINLLDIKPSLISLKLYHTALDANYERTAQFIFTCVCEETYIIEEKISKDDYLIEFLLLAFKYKKANVIDYIFSKEENFKIYLINEAVTKCIEAAFENGQNEICQIILKRNIELSNDILGKMSYSNDMTASFLVLKKKLGSITDNDIFISAINKAVQGNNILALTSLVPEFISEKKGQINNINKIYTPIEAAIEHTDDRSFVLQYLIDRNWPIPDYDKLIKLLNGINSSRASLYFVQLYRAIQNITLACPKASYEIPLTAIRSICEFIISKGLTQIVPILASYKDILILPELEKLARVKEAKDIIKEIDKLKGAQHKHSLTKKF